MPVVCLQVLADSFGPATLEAEKVSAVACKSEDIVVYMSQPSLASASPCSQTASAIARLSDRDRDAGLHDDAARARTRHRGMHPAFVNRLAAAIAEARGAGLPFAGLFSAYRPPAFGVAALSTNFTRSIPTGSPSTSAGIGAPGTPSALLWHEIARQRVSSQRPRRRRQHTTHALLGRGHGPLSSTMLPSQRCARIRHISLDNWSRWL